MSFGGHGDLGRVLRYLATGEAVQAPGAVAHPPHDYGVAVIMYAAADRLVPPEQVVPLREGIGTFLLASQLTLIQHEPGERDLSKNPRHGESLPSRQRRT